MDSSDLIDEAQAAHMLALSIRTMQGWRLRGGGPLYIKIGRAVRYRRGDLAAFIEARVVASTTAADNLQRAA